MANGNGTRGSHPVEDGVHPTRLEWDEDSGGFVLTVWTPCNHGILVDGSADSAVREPLVRVPVSRADGLRMGLAVREVVRDGREARGSRSVARTRQRFAVAKDEALEERRAAIELLAAARGCSLGEAHQLVRALLDVVRAA